MNAYIAQQARERKNYEEQRRFELIKNCPAFHSVMIESNITTCMITTTNQLNTEMAIYDQEKQQEKEALQQRHEQEQTKL